MIRQVLLLGGPVIAVCIMVVLGGLAASRAQPPAAPLTAEDVQDIQNDVAAFLQRGRTAAAVPAAALPTAAVQPASESALVLPSTGALTYPNIQLQINAVGEEALRQKLESVWEVFRPVPIVILLEDPTGKAQVRMDI